MSSMNRELKDAHAVEAEALVLPVSDGAGVLEYARVPDASPSLPVDVAVLLAPVVLTVAALGIVLRSGADADPFSPDPFQASLYLGLGPVVMLSWAGWALYFAFNLAGGRWSRIWTLALLAGVAWGGLLSFGLYNIAAEYIVQTTKIRGAHWPILETLFRP